MKSNKVWEQITQSLWRGKFDISSFHAERMKLDLQGWNSQHPFLGEAILARKPQIVVEIGVWKGGSTIHMAERIRDAGYDGVVIAVDTWLGSWEHWSDGAHVGDLAFENGYPSLYKTFLANVINTGVLEHVVPLPVDSANASFIMTRLGLKADVVHIDGGHDFQAVYSDMERWWGVLKAGGLMIMDDYDAEGHVWPSVRDAVDSFRGVTEHRDFEALPYKARLVKP